MEENNQQAQESNTPNEDSQEARGSEQQNNRDTEPRIPKHRLDEETKKRREAEQKLQQIEQEREQAEEQRATEQGEHKKLAEKRKTDLDKEKTAHAETKANWQRERRLNVWNQAAQGIVRSEAITDAFGFLSGDELNGVDDTDPEAYKSLAQNLVEVRPYLAAEGPKGAGSGGSSRPVMVGAGENKHTNFLGESKRKRRPWK